MSPVRGGWITLEIIYKVRSQFCGTMPDTLLQKQNQNESHLARALSKLQVIVRNWDRFIGLFAPVLIDWINYFVIGFSTVI